GTVTLVSTYTLESVGYELHTKAWSAMTLSFAISQGVVGFIMAYYAAHLASYYILFAVSASALVVSIACIFFTPPQQGSEPVSQSVS
ncbi:MAG: MFS transporter, partial [Photobacterium halotolerans]